MLGNNDEIRDSNPGLSEAKTAFSFPPFHQTASFEIIYWSTEMASLNKNKLGKSDKSSY